jgi:histidinol-phosphate aminotransferase
MKKNAAKVIKTRERLTAELIKLGWDVIPSESNFVFAKPAHKKAAVLFEDLKGRHIYVRYFTGPKTADRLRVTIGTDTEINELLKAIHELDN